MREISLLIIKNMLVYFILNYSVIDKSKSIYYIWKPMQKYG